MEIYFPKHFLQENKKESDHEKEMESTFETLTSRAWLTNVVERRTGVEEVAGSSSRPGQH